MLRSADLHTAVAAGVRRCFDNSGQSCNAPTRLLVRMERMDDAIAVARAAAESIVVGAPGHPATTMGPVVSQLQFDKIQGLIRKGIEEGAALVTGGCDRPAHLNVGYYVKPTVFAHVSNDMTIAQEEIFGPVLVMIGYGAEDEAVAIANDTPYGLASYIQGEPAEARALSRKLRTGIVRINSSGWDGVAPFGGYKQSGNGREYGEFGIHEFTEIKGVVGYADS